MPPRITVSGSNVDSKMPTARAKRGAASSIQKKYADPLGQSRFPLLGTATWYAFAGNGERGTLHFVRTTQHPLKWFQLRKWAADADP